MEGGGALERERKGGGGGEEGMKIGKNKRMNYYF
jgi:hypothetical protein